MELILNERSGCSEYSLHREQLDFSLVIYVSVSVSVYLSLGVCLSLHTSAPIHTQIPTCTLTYYMSLS